ncbi:MAG: DEAD/DEAH box helicase [Desulfamplus sp.]|nr:DEAD/DEAH box helicase [Desulfamplus sp.]
MEEEGFTIRDAMRLQLNPGKMLDLDLDPSDISISSGEWLASVLEKMTSPQQIPDMKPAKGFKATLREYQQKGLNWLGFMDALGFGGCLADDMGLGKTIQVLAFLSTLKKNGLKKVDKSDKGADVEHNKTAASTENAKTGHHGNTRNASLLIIPASLMSNWLSEIQRFFPELVCFPAHPDYVTHLQTLLDKTTDDLNGYDLVITTYALSKKYEWLRDYPWHYIILDEAQAIKNPATKQTRAVKQLKARNRIVMSGTPIENRISDLWSLFDFLNPGLLGNKTEFTRFSKALKDDPEGYSRLRRLVSPYILRRLKTDKSVISDLPEKVEMKVYAGLTKKQVLLYKNALTDLETYLENSQGIQRKGVVLSSLMKFKQLCNHPDQFVGTGEYKEADSGKFSRLREICETIHEKRERVLIFTQFKEMTQPLRHFLKTVFNRDGVVIHGSIPVGKRKKIIEQFQDDAYCPFMVLSLKAGGVGLNLTRANHVIHFDRWWNPAVENQATDRAFRIGQKKNVLVHKFITTGTIEEKIDKIIEEKKDISDKVVSSSGEALITEMDNEDIMELFKLSL